MSLRPYCKQAAQAQDLVDYRPTYPLFHNVVGCKHDCCAEANLRPHTGLFHTDLYLGQAKVLGRGAPGIAGVEGGP